MKLKDWLKTHKGAAARMANEMGVTKSYISQLAAGTASISPARAVQIERITNGGVPRQDIREDWREIWPELIPAALAVYEGESSCTG